MRQIRRVSIGFVACVWLAAAAAAQTPAPAAPRTPPPPEAKGQPMPQGFSVVLVIGDNQLSSTADNVPAAARKALGDIKDFLPYRGYRLLDAQWILGSSRSTSRLRGPDDQEYELTLRSNPVAGGRIQVWFDLLEPGNPFVTAVRPGEETTVERRAEAKAMTAIARRGVIETNFAMDIGETVVVGTSRMRGGDKALIALLTAVSKR